MLGAIPSLGGTGKAVEEGMYQVFISYAQSDSELARRAASTLAESGLDVWWKENNVFPGDNWAAEYAKALENSQAMIVLLSSDSASSGEVLSDLSFALGKKSYKGRLIPVLRKSSDRRVLEELPWVLKTMKPISLDRYPHEEDAFRQIAELIKESWHQSH